MSVTTYWEKFSNKKGKITYFEKKEIYNVKWEMYDKEEEIISSDEERDDLVHFDNYKISTQKHSGMIVMTKDKTKLLKTRHKRDNLPLITVFNSFGKKISEFLVFYLLKKTNLSGFAINIQWTEEGHIMVVTNILEVYIFTLYGKIIKSFSFLEEILDEGILFCETWDSGILIMTYSNNIYSVDNLNDPRIEKHSKYPLNENPLCLSLLFGIAKFDLLLGFYSF
jgi:hypothetical protein